MNINQVASTLKLEVAEVQEAVKSLFTPIPPTFDKFQINQIKKYCEEPSKKLEQLPPSANQKQSDKTQEQHSQERIKRLISAAQMAGRTEAELYNSIKNDTFTKHTQAGDDAAFNEFINGAIAHTIQAAHAARNADDINGTVEVEVTEVNATPVDIKALKPADDDDFQQDWLKLLNPGK